MVNCSRKPIVENEVWTLPDLAAVASAGGVPVSALLAPQAKSSMPSSRVWATKTPGKCAGTYL